MLPSPQAVGPCTCFPASTLDDEGEGCESGVEAPAGDFECRAKDLGTYKLGHDDLMAEAG